MPYFLLLQSPDYPPAETLNFTDCITTLYVVRRAQGAIIGHYRPLSALFTDEHDRRVGRRARRNNGP